MSVPANQTQESRHLSQERADHRQWIGGRAVTLLSHYWRDDDPVELTAAIGADWADVLEGLPQEYIQRACVRYQREEPRRKPTPGAIYQLVRRMMPVPRVAPVSMREEPKEPRVTADVANDILAKAGFAPKRFGRKA